MCKILTVTGIKKKDQKKAARIMWAAANRMPKDDPHGWGYAAIGPRGEVFSEKWLNPKDALISRDKLVGNVAQFVEALGSAVSPSTGYDTTGRFDNTSTLIMHSRWATCGISLENTHPFVNGHTALIHNGVIGRSEGLRFEQSTCDSELILNAYVDADVAHYPERIQWVTDKLYGSYACAVLTKDKEGRAILDVFRNDGSNLVMGWLNTMQAAVFCTTAPLAEAIMKDANLSFKVVGSVESGHLIRIDALTGKVISVTQFTPRAVRSAYEDWKSKYSKDEEYEDWWRKNGKESIDTDYRDPNDLSPAERVAAEIMAEKEEERLASLSDDDLLEELETEASELDEDDEADAPAIYVNGKKVSEDEAEPIDPKFKEEVEERFLRLVRGNEK